MATKKSTATQVMGAMRRCIGSTTFGIEAHEAPVDDFPVQESPIDGLGRMCGPHCRKYTKALRKAAVSRKTSETATEPIAETAVVSEAEPEAPAPWKARRVKVEAEPEEVAAA